MQKPTTKKAAAPPQPQKQGPRLVDRLFRQLFGLSEGWHKQRDIARNNYELGIRQFRLSNLSDAIFRFKLVTWMEPKNPDGWYWLGRACLRDGKYPQAIEALQKAQQLKPDQEDTRYMLTLAMGEKAPAELLPTRMPPALVREHFDGLAPSYLETVEAGGHKGHRMVAEAARAAAEQGRIDHVALDLGVGTGLCAASLHDICSHITGVDIAGEMLSRAMQLTDGAGKKLYDALIHREALDFLGAAADNSFDMVLAAGLVDYVGDLEALWQQVARVLKKGGLFAMTASCGEGDGYRFNARSESFTFSEHYLRALAEKNGMAVLKLEKATVAPGYIMWLCVFKKQ